MDTALFSRSTVAANTDLTELIPAIESAFAAYAADEVIMPPKSYVDLPAYNGDFRSMPAYVRGSDWDAAGIKWVNSHPDNPRRHDLPTVMGVMIYSDPATGRPLAIMDGTELTRQRTAAAAAVATDRLAVADATRLGVIGAGAQSLTQVEAIAHVRDITEIIVTDPDSAAIETFVDRLDDRFAVGEGTPEEAGHCDILTTLTPVTDPIVTRDHVGSRTHINAMGADAAGKQEIETDVLLAAKLVIDDYEQCTHSGEINVPWSQHRLVEADIHGTLGEVIQETCAGRTPDDGITVFDSTGLAIQDIAAARVIFENAGSDVPRINLLELD